MSAKSFLLVLCFWRSHPLPIATLPISSRYCQPSCEQSLYPVAWKPQRVTSSHRMATFDASTSETSKNGWKGGKVAALSWGHRSELWKTFWYRIPIAIARWDRSPTVNCCWGAPDTHVHRMDRTCSCWWCCGGDAADQTLIPAKR